MDTINKEDSGPTELETTGREGGGEVSQAHRARASEKRQTYFSPSHKENASLQSTMHPYLAPYESLPARLDATLKD